MNSQRHLKLGISCIAFSLGWIRDALARMLGFQRPPRCMVLYYHSIPDRFRHQFARQLDAICGFAEAIHPERPVLMENGHHYCLVTFDDGFSNFLTNAAPELVRRSIPAIIFIISGAMGKSFGPLNAPERLMTAAEVQKLPDTLFVVGSHTVSHPYLPELRREAAQVELCHSRLTLEEVLGKRVRYFSFPFGGLTPELVAMSKQAGYERVYSTMPSFAPFGEDDFCVGRVRVDPWDYPIEFHLKLAGAYNWLPRAIALKKKLLASPVGPILFKRLATRAQSARQSSVYE